MTPFQATVTKSQTADNFWKLLPNGPVKIGDVLDVDLDSRRMEKRVRGNTNWEGEVIERIVGNERQTWPTEILDL